MKSISDRIFFDATDIIKNVTVELGRHAQNGFRLCFRYLWSRYHKFICKRVCFEGNV